MSAYKIYSCTFTDKEVLLEALNILGLKTEVHDEPQPLTGYEGHARKQMAQIIVPQKSLNETFTRLSNDLGFAWNAARASYDMVVSDYDIGQKMPERIRQAYAKVALEHLMDEYRFTIEESTDNSKLTQRARVDVNIVASIII